jgi:hypothetical protein
VYGLVEIRSIGRAPSSLRVFMKSRTFSRYWALDGVHGVVVWAPLSSFRAIHGREHPVEATARK